MVGLSLLVACAYGPLSYAVVRRRMEIGIRMAFGASPFSVMRMVMADALQLIAPGILLGAAGTWAATRLLASLLYGVNPSIHGSVLLAWPFC
jgi:ABC-type antimicrobial peptide transport system permease subunit